MTSPKETSIDLWLDDALERLINQSDIGACLYACVKTIVDRPENDDFFFGSYAGYAVHLQNQCVLNEFQLWLARVWEPNGYSLPKFGKRITHQHKAIARARLARRPDMPHTFLELHELDKIVTSFCGEVSEISQSDLVARLKVRRDEKFAHILNYARSRKRLKELNVEDGYSLNELFPLALKTLDLISEARRIWRFEVAGQQQFIEIMSKRYESYWRLLPNFAEVEGET